MSPQVDIFELDSLGLASGQAHRLDVDVPIGDLQYGSERYSVQPKVAAVRVDVSRTTGSGYVLRLRSKVTIEGPCMRCLTNAQPQIEVDTREVHQPGSGEELRSPYVSDQGELDLTQWARDAIVLSFPTQIMCRPDCAGLCSECGINLNENPDHGHEPPPDSRWGKLSELRFD